MEDQKRLCRLVLRRCQLSDPSVHHGACERLARGQTRGGWTAATPITSRDTVLCRSVIVRPRARHLAMLGFMRLEVPGSVMCADNTVCMQCKARRTGARGVYVHARREFSNCVWLLGARASARGSRVECRVTVSLSCAQTATVKIECCPTATPRPQRNCIIGPPPDLHVAPCAAFNSQTGVGVGLNAYKHEVDHSPLGVKPHGPPGTKVPGPPPKRRCELFSETQPTHELNHHL